MERPPSWVGEPAHSSPTTIRLERRPAGRSPDGGSGGGEDVASRARTGWGSRDARTAASWVAAASTQRPSLAHPAVPPQHPKEVASRKARGVAAAPATGLRAWVRCTTGGLMDARGVIGARTPPPSAGGGAGSGCTGGRRRDRRRSRRGARSRRDARRVAERAGSGSRSTRRGLCAVPPEIILPGPFRRGR